MEGRAEARPLKLGDRSERHMSVTGRFVALGLITLLGCALRLLSAFWAPNEFPAWADSQNYLSIASNVAKDFNYANSWRPPKGHPRFGDIGPTSYREPIYPLFLALQLKLFGNSPRTVFVTQALLGALAIPLCFGLGILLLSSRAALFGAFIESVNLYHISYVGRIASENIATIVLLVVVYLTLRVFRSISAGKPISRRDLTFLTLSLSAAVLTRAVFVPVAAVTLIFIGAACYRRTAAVLPAARTVGLLALLITVCVSPWFIRNYLVWNTFVYQTNSGHNMLMGYSDFATGGYENNRVHTRVLEIDRALEPHGHNELERDRIFKQEALQWIRSHPLRAIYLFVKKQVLFWSPMPATVEGYMKQVGFIWAASLLSLTLIGVLRARGDRLSLNYLFAVICVFSLVHSLALAVTRYRIPLEGLLAVFAGCGLSLLLNVSSQLSPHRLGVGKN